MGYGPPLSEFSGNAAGDALLPAIDPFLAAAAMKSDSGITCNLPLPRKRPRDVHPTSNNRFFSSVHPQKNCGRFYLLGEDISIHIQQQQFDLDRLLSQHMENVRMEVEEKRKRQARRLLEVIEMGMVRILRNKEEEIQKIGKLNYELEERVNSLCMENQIWRDVAQTNEATANALRTNLEHVLSQVRSDPTRPEDPTTTELADDAESCCGSNGGEDGKGREMTEGNGNGQSENGDRRCKNCWKEESCVLLLPCRHLCLCTVCGSSLHTCPICNSINNASVRVILP